MTAAADSLQMISIELTGRCSKGCWFCYNHSAPDGASLWTPGEVTGFVRDCAAHGVRSISLGGGEPLEYEALEETAAAIAPLVYLTMTSNGRAMDAARAGRLAALGMKKIHYSIHFPQDPAEVERAAKLVALTQAAGMRGGVNLLVSAQHLDQAQRASQRLSQAGLTPEQIVYLPMRLHHTPTPAQVAQVAGGTQFQSTHCMTRCGASPRFASVSWDKQAAWCSYTAARRPLSAPTFQALTQALEGLAIIPCGVAARELEPSGQSHPQTTIKRAAPKAARSGHSDAGRA